MTLRYVLLEFKNYENCHGQFFMFCLSAVVPKETLNVSHLRTEGKRGVIILHSSTNLLAYSEHKVDNVTNLVITVDKKPSVNKS